MTSPDDLARLVQARLDREYPGQYSVSPQGGHHIEGDGTDFCVRPSSDDGVHGAVFHLDNLVPQQKGVDAAADRLFGTIAQVIGAGLPEKRAGEYLAYDAL